MDVRSPNRYLDQLRVLAHHDVEFIVVGGVAAILEGAPISTFDLDIVFRRSELNNERLATALRQINARYKDPAGRRIEPDATKLATININLLETDLGQLDVLSRVGHEYRYEDLLHRSADYEVGDLRLKVLGLEAVIECKEIAGREKDLATLPVLRRTLEVRNALESETP